MESKFRTLSEENQAILARWMDLKQKEAEVMNLENQWHQKY